MAYRKLFAYVYCMYILCLNFVSMYVFLLSVLFLYVYTVAL